MLCAVWFTETYFQGYILESRHVQFISLFLLYHALYIHEAVARVNCYMTDLHPFLPHSLTFLKLLQ